MSFWGMHVYRAHLGNHEERKSEQVRKLSIYGGKTMTRSLDPFHSIPFQFHPNSIHQRFSPFFDFHSRTQISNKIIAGENFVLPLHSMTIKGNYPKFDVVYCGWVCQAIRRLFDVNKFTMRTLRHGDGKVQSQTMVDNHQTMLVLSVEAKINFYLSGARNNYNRSLHVYFTQLANGRQLLQVELLYKKTSFRSSLVTLSKCVTNEAATNLGSVCQFRRNDLFSLYLGMKHFHEQEKFHTLPYQLDCFNLHVFSWKYKKQNWKSRCWIVLMPHNTKLLWNLETTEKWLETPFFQEVYIIYCRLETN